MNVKTAERTLHVFEAFATLGKPLTLSELAEHIDVPVSSCFGLLRTLENQGYLYALSRRRGFYPTRRLYKMAHKIARHDVITDVMQTALQQLCDHSGETIVLSKQQDDRIIYIDVYDSPNSIRYNTKIGYTRELHCSSAGKAFLGTLTDEQLEQTVSTLTLSRYTDKTLTSVAALTANIRQYRDHKGWYGNDGESVSDLVGIAVTLELEGLDYAVSVAGPMYRLQPRMEEIGAKLLALKQQVEVANID